MNQIRKLFSKRPAYYFAFPIVIGGLFGASLIQAPCPVCSGSGILSYSIGMDDVTIVSLRPRIISTAQDACTAYIVVKAEPVIIAKNSGSIDATGYVKLTLTDVTSNNADLVSIHVRINVPADSMATLQAGNVGFVWVSSDLPPTNLDMRCEAVDDASVPCISCKGGGMTNFSSYFLLKYFRDNFVSSIIDQSHYNPDGYELINGELVAIGSDKWLEWMELN